MPTTLEKVGARIYFRDAPFAGKDVLKAGGAHWDATARCWWIGVVKEEEAGRLAKYADEEAARTTSTSRPFKYHKCKQCGAKPDARGWPRIYKNGVCSDCYREALDD